MIAEVEARDVLNRVGAAMARLSPKTREIFMAHRLDGLSYKEIGEKTGLSVKGVEWHMSKAIAHIARAVSTRECLGTSRDTMAMLHLVTQRPPGRRNWASRPQERRGGQGGV